MKRIGVVTTSRADYGSLLPILRAMQSDPEVELLLFVSGMHLSRAFGFTVREIETDGFPITDRVDMLLASDTVQAVAKSIGIGMMGFADSLAHYRPDVVLIVGDRYELLAVVSVALGLCIPIAHVSGGDVTEGAIDNQVRHAISKMSHLHFVAMQAHADRLMQMGEESWRVFVTGDPALDLLYQTKLLTRKELDESLGINLDPPVLLVTLHPTTLGSVPVAQEIDGLLTALSRITAAIIFTYPNADAQSEIIVKRIQDFTAGRSDARLFFNLGQRKYYSLMAQVDLMVGNSSSGIWEAPSFRLPVVNVGQRQQGRFRAGNVIDVDGDADTIYRAIQRALEPSFRASFRALQNPYGDGQAASRVVEVLRRLTGDSRLLQKRFVDLPVTRQESGKDD